LWGVCWEVETKIEKKESKFGIPIFNMEQKNHNNNHGGGFLLGIIVGVIITLLFTTKRGREIFKELTEKGLEKFSDLEAILQDVKEREFSDEEEENDYVEPASKPIPASIVEPEPVVVAKPVAKATVAAVKKEQPPVRKVEEKEEKPTPKPKEEPVQEEVKAEVLAEEKPAEKSTHGRRWFRGLRKKS
jgi:hypothetical protein